jgi:release factor glutamine methyltransferase
VTRDVLVPRPETEHVVEAALDDLRARRRRNLRVVDVGTGSGAIGVTLACELPELSVIATEISAPALAVARRNARRHAVEERLSFLQGDLLEPLGPNAAIDCIVANLPYVPSADVPAVPNPVAHEPLVAVDGGPDGLDPYRRLLAQLSAVAVPGASVFLEAAPPTIWRLAELVERALPSAHIEIVDDYAGLDRFLAISLP